MIHIVRRRQLEGNPYLYSTPYGQLLDSDFQTHPMIWVRRPDQMIKLVRMAMHCNLVLLSEVTEDISDLIETT